MAKSSNSGLLRPDTGPSPHVGGRRVPGTSRRYRRDCQSTIQLAPNRVSTPRRAWFALRRRHPLPRHEMTGPGQALRQRTFASMAGASHLRWRVIPAIAHIAGTAEQRSRDATYRYRPREIDRDRPRERGDRHDSTGQQPGSTHDIAGRSGRPRADAPGLWRLSLDAGSDGPPRTVASTIA